MKNMRRWMAVILAGAMAAASLTGCQGTSGQGSDKSVSQADGTGAKTEGGDDKGKGEKDGRPIGAALIVNGTIGDKSFNDLAYAGFQKAEKEFGIKGTLVENNYDTTKYEPSIIEFAEDPDCDIIVVNGADVKEIIEKVAPEYPEKRFIIYDSDIDYSLGDLSNVYSTTFKQNEASFLAGALGAKMTSITGDDRVNPERIIGFVAGGENVIINDFLLGYIQGCEYGDPEAKMLISYIGNFSDAAKGKEMGLSQVAQGADVIFSVASGAGLGILEAAKESHIYAIGVDDDQYSLFQDSDPEQAQAILTSVLKRVDNCVYTCMKRYMDGTLPFGQTEALGLEQGMVDIAKNEYYKEKVPEDVQAFIAETEQKIISGEIKVETNIGADISVINDAKDRIKP